VLFVQTLETVQVSKQAGRQVSSFAIKLVCPRFTTAVAAKLYHKPEICMNSFTFCLLCFMWLLAAACGASSQAAALHNWHVAVCERW